MQRLLFISGVLGAITVGALNHHAASAKPYPDANTFTPGQHLQSYILPVPNIK